MKFNSNIILDIKPKSSDNSVSLYWVNTYLIKYDSNKLKSIKYNYNYTPYVWNIFDINFIKKERIYTKLKYSRVPQYDIVSGGVAAIFAGFLGFLICEKFGFELIDSGDFYYLFIYIVFLSMFSKLFLKIMSSSQNDYNILSLKWLLSYIKVIAKLLTNNFSK